MSRYSSKILSASDIVSSFSSLFRISSGREEDLDLLRVTGTGRPYLSDPPVSKQSCVCVNKRCVGFKKKSKQDPRLFLRLSLSVFESVRRTCDKTISIEKMHILTVIFAGIVTLLSHVATASSKYYESTRKVFVRIEYIYFRWLFATLSISLIDYQQSVDFCVFVRISRVRN